MSTERVEESSLYSALDLALAKQFVGDKNTPLFCIIAALSKALSQGHCFLPLAQLAQSKFLSRSYGLPKKPLKWWLSLLEDAPFEVVILTATEHEANYDQALLVLDAQNNLYFSKYFIFEQRLAENLTRYSKAADGRSNNLDYAVLAQRLVEYFPQSQQQLDYQALAVALALIKPLCIISGGPGTGKTTTVVTLLALLLESSTKALRIGLAAPTGKAAARLAQSIKSRKADLTLADELLAQVPEQAQTIHRLIYAQRQAKSKLLAFDVLILDEASMIDLALMQQLLLILPKSCKLILLGDKDQLPAVELGNLMADLCQQNLLDSFSPATWQELGLLLPQLSDLGNLTQLQPGQKKTSNEAQLDLLAQQENPFNLAQVDFSAWADASVQLKVSYRFDSKSGIGRLASAVNNAQAEQALAVLAAADFSDVSLTLKPSRGVSLGLVNRAADLYQAYLQAQDTQQAFRCFNQVQVLAGVRQGPHGVESLNVAIEQALIKRGLIKASNTYYKGLVVIITANHYPLNLFNGDIGLFDYDSEGRLKCFFEQADGGLRAVAPALLPAYEPAYALTVHKSQGSEFDQVLMILPNAPSPLLSKEMLYTGITRAKKQLYLYGDESEVSLACANASQRYSALPQRLAQLSS